MNNMKVAFIFLIFWLKTEWSFQMINNTYYFLSAPDGNEKYAEVLKLISNVSGIKCHIICQQNANKCNGVHIVEEVYSKMVTCYLLSKALGNESDELLPDGNTYIASTCQYRKNPCNSNPCLNGGTCVIQENNNCSKLDYSCLCPQSHASPNCGVDITDSVYLDGIYFHIPKGPRNGSEIADMQPNCTESRQRCLDRGMQLMTIMTEQKNATVANLLSDSLQCSRCFYRMGLSRRNLGEPFIWDHGDGLADFDNWYPGYPSLDNNSFYGVLSPILENKWIDVRCNFLAYYVCEYDPSLQ